MRLFIILTTLFLLLPSIAFSEREMLEKVESEVYQTNGTKQEIAKKAKRCIATQVRDREVILPGSKASSRGFSQFLYGGGKEGKDDNTYGGDAFLDVDIEEGIIIANNKINYQSRLIPTHIKSTMTFLAKEGRFKIKHTNIRNINKNNPYTNKDHTKIAKAWGTGWRDAEKALKVVSGQIAECVQKIEKEDDW
jgi:hypothetical protein